MCVWVGGWVLDFVVMETSTMLPFADFGSWVTLTELNLGTNQLTVLPDDIQELTRLEVLSLANNAIRVSGCVRNGWVWSLLWDLALDLVIVRRHWGLNRNGTVLL